MQVYKGIALGKCAQPIGVNGDHEQFKMILSYEIVIIIFFTNHLTHKCNL